MNGSGWIKLYRKAMFNDVWVKSSPTLWKVWCWCLMRANFEDNLHPFNDEMIPLKEGQFITGKFKGATEVRLKPDNFWQLLKRLEKLGCVSLNTKSKSYTIVTIVNWNEYQHPENSDLHTQLHTQQHTKQKNAKPLDTHSVSEIEKGLHTQLHTQLHHTEKNEELRSINTQQDDLFSKTEHDASSKKTDTIKHPMQIWINENTDLVKKIPKQLTYKQCEDLLQQYPKDVIKETLLDMDNYKGTKNYRSLYRTLLNWLKRNEQFQKSKSGNHPQQPETTIKYFN